LDFVPDSSLFVLENLVLGVEHPQLLLLVFFLGLLPLPVVSTPFEVRFGNFLGPGTSHTRVDGRSAVCLGGCEPWAWTRYRLDDTLGPGRGVGIHLNDTSFGVDDVRSQHRCGLVIEEGL